MEGEVEEDMRQAGTRMVEDRSVATNFEEQGKEHSGLPRQKKKNSCIEHQLVKTDSEIISYCCINELSSFLKIHCIKKMCLTMFVKLIIFVNKCNHLFNAVYINLKCQ